MTAVPYYFFKPKRNRVPMILSIPHCGTEFPDELVSRYDPKLLENLDDTDWYLDKLYDFADDLGVTVIHAKYSRWVIDLNREPGSQPLYNDGRLITALCPTTDFTGASLYTTPEFEPTDREIESRLSKYFNPYHGKISEIIEELKSEFDRVLFWDAHSIRRSVPAIRGEPFPDFILGDNDGKTASESLVACALDSLRSDHLTVNHNDPFKGGFLTRSMGNPENGVHALQLEMSKDLYMSNGETEYDIEKAKPIKALLKSTFANLIAKL